MRNYLGLLHTDVRPMAWFLRATRVIRGCAVQAVSCQYVLVL